jgi:hypothetical protein
VDELRDAVKDKFSVKLKDVDANDLTVHRTRNDDALLEDASIPSNTTRTSPLYIKAPAQEFVPSENPTNPLFTTNVLSTTDLFCLFSFQFQHSATISSTYRSQCLPTLTLLVVPLRSYVPTRASVGVGGASGENANHNNRSCVNLCFQQFYLSPPPRTTLNVSSPQSRFPFRICFFFLIIHTVLFLCVV